jgi:hypothetical protein
VSVAVRPNNHCEPLRFLLTSRCVSAHKGAGSLHRNPEQSTELDHTLTSTPKPRQVTGWIIRPIVERTEQEQADLTRILGRCQVLRRIDELVSDFAGMLRQRQGQHLDTWIAHAQASDIQQMQGFAAGLLRTTTPSGTDSPSPGAAARLKAQ